MKVRNCFDVGLHDRLASSLMLGGELTLITPLLKRDRNNEPLESSKKDFRDVIRAVFESSRAAGSSFKWGRLIAFFLLFRFSLKLKLVFVSIERKLQHIRRSIQLRPQGFLLQKWEGSTKKALSTRLWLVRLNSAVVTPCTIHYHFGKWLFSIVIRGGVHNIR